MTGIEVELEYELDTAIDDCVEGVLDAEASAEPRELADDPDDGPEDPTVEAAYDATEHDHMEDHDPEADDEAGLTRAANIVVIGDILGVPLLYERFKDGSGSKPTSFPVARAFLPTLEATVKQVQERVPPSYGRLLSITSAGMKVSKTGRHGEGRACDWDRVTFENVEIAPIARDHASPSLATRRRYWAFAAICRSNACFVLHGRYNKAHEDHIHSDSSTGVGFNGMESTVKLLQSVLNEIFGASPALVVDGDFGSKTKTALGKAQAKVGVSGDIHDVTVWRQFLRRSARLGFTLSAA